MEPIEIGPFRPSRLRRPASLYERLVLRAFHRLYYESWQHGGRRGSSPATLSIGWLGRELIKCPLDLWVYQELLVERRPDFVIECGTYRGGSALFLATVMDLVGHGALITIDPHDYDGRPQHPRIRYLRGSSTTPETVAAVREAVGDARCFVILDSDHAQAHVARELELYRDFVAVGDYLIVEDTNLNGHPVSRRHGPGPMEAVEDFLRADGRFQSDPRMERFLLTLNPRGYLLRVR
jgi:cephalosporin hydroxylase